MKLPEIIGVAGTNGAGKDTLADLRFEKQGILKVGLSDILRTEEATRALAEGRDPDFSRESLGLIGKEWARQFGAAALALMTLKEYADTKTDETKGISLVSIRRLAEAEAIKDAGGTIIWVDADRELRYRRLQEAKRDRPEDLDPFDVFCAKEDFEMYPASDDPFLMNMAGVRDSADIHLENNYEDNNGLTGKERYEAFLKTAFELAS